MALSAGGYAKHKQKALERVHAQARLGQEIAPCPPIKNQARRAAADNDFRFFCETYFSPLFYFKWSEDHLRVIEKIERTVLKSETFAIAMPRGTGKTTLCQIAVMWSVLIGQHQFVYLISGTADLAKRSLDNIKAQLETNELLYEDYPEVCYPIRKLDGETRRCMGQRYYGRQTNIDWTNDEIGLPNIPGSRCAGSVIRVAGITGNFRGAVHTLSTGKNIRPSLAVIDDPQTDESARSLTQINYRMAVINGAVAGLSGPGKPTALICPCTVIQAGDLADQILNRRKNPRWHGERTKLIYALPNDEKMWDQYAAIRADELRADGDGSKCNAFYAEHREQMDAGAKVSWPERHNKNELSAVQYAMNLKIDNPEAFASEYQNEPLITDAQANARAAEIPGDETAMRINGIPRGKIPRDAFWVTAFVDVQKYLLPWAVCAWAKDFTGYVVDYGVFPDQAATHWSAARPHPKLDSIVSGSSEAQIHGGINLVLNSILGREWPKEDGTISRVNLCAIDANWGEMTDVVYDTCRRSIYAANLLPSHGRYVGGSSRPFSEYRTTVGDFVGLNLMIPAAGGRRAARHLVYDSNFWKSFLRNRFVTAQHERGAMTLYGNSPIAHMALMDHLTSETPVVVFGRGREVEEWKLKPGRENHWFDALVGTAVCAAVCGANLGQVVEKPKAVGNSAMSPKPSRPLTLPPEFQRERF